MMNKFSKKWNFESLLSISINYIVNNLSELSANDIILISQLPEHIRNSMLHKFTVSKYFWENVEFNTILKALTHKNSEHLDLTSCTVDDMILKIIEPCQNLRKLYLTSVEQHLITTYGLLHLIPHLKHIYLLRISHCDAVTDDVTHCIAKNCCVLAGLDVGGCQNVTDKTCMSMLKMEHLKWLTFSNTQVSDKGMEYLVQGPSGCNLKELRIANCPNITENVLKTVANHCPNLEILTFNNCSRMKDLSCFTFQEGSLKNLKQINWTIEW